jgi:ABC-type multidrug transport system fused ATPase/permease subunit
MADGKIVEQGSWDELLLLENGFFRKMCIEQHLL